MDGRQIRFVQILLTELPVAADEEAIRVEFRSDGEEVLAWNMTVEQAQDTLENLRSHPKDFPASVPVPDGGDPLLVPAAVVEALVSGLELAVEAIARQVAIRRAERN